MTSADAAIADTPAGPFDAGPLDAGPLDAGPPDALACPMAPRGMTDVTGTAIDTFISDVGRTDAPEDLSAQTIVALVPYGPPGCFTTFPGVGRADGTFTIPGVPSGLYYLGYRLGSFLVTSARTVDLGEERIGRPDATRPNLRTPVTLDVAGLSPWRAGDLLAISSVGAGAFSSYLADLGPAPVSVGATTLTGFTIDWQNAATMLIDARRGDRALVLQFTTRSAGSLWYQAVAKAVDVSPVVIEDGLPSRITGTLVDLPQQVVNLDWRGAEIEAVVAEGLGPGFASAYAEIDVQPPGFSGVAGRAAELLEATSLPSGDGVLALQLGNPYPTTWPRTALAIGYRSRTIGGIALGFGTYVMVPLASAGPIRLGPIVSPPRALRANGQPASSGTLAGVGLTPLISWQPPTLGTPDSYAVTIFDLSGRRVRVIDIETTDTSVMIPPGFLATGASHVIVVSAKITGSPAPLQRPFRQGWTLGAADAITGMVLP
jgi:hypothetical protein